MNYFVKPLSALYLIKLRLLKKSYTPIDQLLRRFPRARQRIPAVSAKLLEEGQPELKRGHQDVNDMMRKSLSTSPLKSYLS